MKKRISNKSDQLVKYHSPGEIRMAEMKARQPIENEWVFRPDVDYYEFQQDNDGTFWKRDAQGWVGRDWWPEVNITDGRMRWRETMSNASGSPLTGEVVYEKPMVLQLIELLAGKTIRITHIDSNQKSSRGVCKTAHAAPTGQKEQFDIELTNGTRYGFVPDTVDVTSAEGGMGWVRGRRRFELV